MISLAKLVKVRDVATATGVSPYILKKLITSGELRGQKVGSTYYVEEESVKEYFHAGGDAK